MFEKDEQELVVNLLIKAVVTTAVKYYNGKTEILEDLLIAVRALAKANTPIDTFEWVRPKGDYIGAEQQIDALIRAEGIDPNREFNTVDPRSLKPRCIHGLFFSEQCPECEKSV